MTEAKMEEDVKGDTWETEKQIKFSMASVEDIEELNVFMHQNFLTDEPLSRNSKIAEGDGWMDNYFRSFMDKVIVVDPISQGNVAPATIIARSTTDNAMVGYRIGIICDRANLEPDGVPHLMLWIAGLPAFLPIPTKMVAMANTVELLGELKYCKSAAFDALKDAQRIYFAISLTVSKKARGMGLGAEMAKRGYGIAAKNGCDYTYVLASSLYSQRIFHKLGNATILQEFNYEDYKYDKKGRPFITDPKEHKVLQLLAIAHREV